MARNRKRPGKVRTKRNNRREPLLLSTMAPEDYNVRPDEVMSIACPDCRTWRRIMGTYDLKIREHCISGKVAEGTEHTLCPGSNQAVIVDIDVRRWQVRQDRLLREAMPQDNRRAAQQFYKPLPAPAVPVSRITAEVTLEGARQSYLAHRKGCIRCVGGQHCLDGGPLARRFVLALQQDPARREAEREAVRQAHRQERARLGFRAAQWDMYGTTVEAANNQCRKRESDTLSEFRGPGLPMLPQDVTAYDRRQAELGKQYGRKRPAPSAT
ncbi:hypothetical protein GCM10010329_80860 [Streptomyces spiroverticillatus]|uniref:Uncharacterized protein n=1 Tax=Streptomyces finlayi TaxID=67296 RepID=A0A918X6Y2_9ACTN|nr:hypothetical protein [Streptomyces finlayi]GHA46057.1 hypothetical protein GCM10010329_80860 [Streptomyces spiroverticillatus]GHD16091.1 hypothetical protein GCM10010334_76780 [Streptomyces finlayi]